MTLSSASRRRTAIASAFALVAGLLTLSAPLSASADVVGDGPGTISGTVTLADGSPVAGALINVSKPAGEGSAWGFSTNSDANGAYEFTGLPADEIYVQIYIPGYQQPAGQTVTLTDLSPTATVNFVLEEFVVGVGTISGLVTADGVPVANASVSAYNQATSQQAYTTTDENGAYQFTELSNGQWNVNVHIGFEYQPLFSRWVTITDAEPAGSAQFPFESWPTGTASISGVFTDLETGAPVQGVSVQISGVDVAHQSSAYTDENGAFTRELLPSGEYQLSYWAFGYLGFSENVQAVSDETVTLSHALVPANATVSGRIQTADGTSVEGLYVDAHNAAGNFGGAVTDADGNYVITGLGAVEYTLSIGGAGTAYDSQQRTVLPISNADVVENFTVVTRSTAYIAGWVLQPSGEYYGEPVCVTLYSTKSKKPIAEMVTIGEEFGDGSFFFDEVTPGSYTVGFRDCDNDPRTKFDKVFLGGVKNFKDATVLTVVAGQNSYENTVVLTPRH